MNKVILTGNIVNPIQLRYTNSDKAVVSNTIAVKRDKKDENGEYQADFINFVAWEKQAEYLNDYATKGDRLELVGHWVVRTYTDSKGLNKIINEVVIESLSLYSKKKETTEEKQEDVKTYKDVMDNLPF